MAARKFREKRPDELAALQKYGGLTARQWRAKNSKFKGLEASKEAQTRSGNFEIVGLFEGKLDRPDTNHFSSYPAALFSFQKLVSNTNLRALKLVENTPLFTEKGEPNGMKAKVWLSFVRSDFQQFANSKAEGLWKRPGEVGFFSTTAIQKNEKLAKLLEAGQLEFVKLLYTGGEAWWESRK